MWSNSGKKFTISEMCSIKCTRGITEDIAASNNGKLLVETAGSIMKSMSVDKDYQLDQWQSLYKVSVLIFRKFSMNYPSYPGLILCKILDLRNALGKKIGTAMHCHFCVIK